MCAEASADSNETWYGVGDRCVLKPSHSHCAGIGHGVGGRCALRPMQTVMKYGMV